VVEILDDDRTSLGGDAASETTGKRYLHALANLLLQSSCGTCDEYAALLVEQQHRGGVDFQGAADALQKLGEHVLQGHVAERGVGDAQEVVAETLRDGGAEREASVASVLPLVCLRFELLGLHGSFIPVFGRAGGVSACCLFDRAACFAGAVLGFALELLAGATGLGARFAGGTPDLLLDAAFELFGLALRSLGSVAHCLLLAWLVALTWSLPG
jgi:hypothetical protein